MRGGAGRRRRAPRRDRRGRPVANSSDGDGDGQPGWGRTGCGPPASPSRWAPRPTRRWRCWDRGWRPGTAGAPRSPGPTTSPRPARPPVPRDRAAELAPRREFDAVLRDDGLPGTGTRIVHGQGAFPPEPVDLDGGAAAALASLHAAGTRALLLDGGQPLAQPFLDAGLVDEVRVHVPTAPGDDGRAPPPARSSRRSSSRYGCARSRAWWSSRPPGGPRSSSGAAARPTRGRRARRADRRDRGARPQRGAGLGPSVRRLHDYLAERFPLAWRDHDRRQRQHRRHLGRRLPAGRRARPACGPCTSTARAGAGRCAPRGRRATPPVVAYMDVDLSTDLDALLPLVAPLVSGHSDVAIGTRLAPRRPGRARARSAR